MGKHLIIAGHGIRRNNTFDPGANGFITKGEHRYVKEVLFPAMKKFLPKNHNVVFFDKYNVYDYGNIASLAKQYNADEITEVHYDAASASASGGHVIIHSNYSPDKKDLALRDAIKKMVGVRYSHKGHSGISGRNNLANVNRTKDAGITYRLIELGFGTNKTDAKIMVEDIEAYAKELVEAITGTSVNKTPSKAPSIKSASNVSKPTTKSTTSTSGSLGLVDYMNSKGMDSSYSNRKKLAAQYGISGYKGTASQNNTLLAKIKGGKPSITSKPKANLKVDGYIGAQTIKALQRYFGTPVDGVLSKPSSLVIKKLQKLLGVTQDGITGKNTISAMQRRFGTVIDGKLSSPSLVIKELQRRLNKGKL